MLLSVDSSDFSPRGLLVTDFRSFWLLDFALEEIDVLISPALLCVPALQRLACGHGGF